MERNTMRVVMMMIAQMIAGAKAGRF